MRDCANLRNTAVRGFLWKIQTLFCAMNHVGKPLVVPQRVEARLPFAVHKPGGAVFDGFI
jgi:hypothetical protein